MTCRRVLSRMLDPYYEAPLWPTSIDVAALQARAMIDAGLTSEAAMADIAHRSRTAAASQPARPADLVGRAVGAARRGLPGRAAAPPRLRPDHRRRRGGGARRRRPGP